MTLALWPRKLSNNAIGSRFQPESSPCCMQSVLVPVNLESGTETRLGRSQNQTQPALVVCIRRWAKLLSHSDSFQTEAFFASHPLLPIPSVSISTPYLDAFQAPTTHAPKDVCFRCQVAGKSCQLRTRWSSGHSPCFLKPGANRNKKATRHHGHWRNTEKVRTKHQGADSVTITSMVGTTFILELGNLYFSCPKTIVYILSQRGYPKGGSNFPERSIPLLFTVLKHQQRVPGSPV